jgi:ABC-2 type transport system ATP-binding protein
MIQVQNVTKRYGQHLSVDDVSFEVKKGEILGFLGPNGAGKSTTMNILTGYISATEGSVRVDGMDIMEEPVEVKRRIGYLPEFPPLYVDMTVEEYLDFVYDIKKTGLARDKQRQEDMDRILELTKIQDMKGRLIKNLSKGYKQRVGLAQALIGDPQVLILDEPTVGLDPKQIIEIRSLIKKLGREHTIILSSHILPEVSAVCERVIIINDGRIVASDTMENLSRGLDNKNRLLLRVAGSENSALKAIKAVDGVKYAEAQGVKETDTVDILVEADMDIRRPLFNALARAQYPILMMRPLDMSLEDIFLRVTAGDKEVH